MNTKFFSPSAAAPNKSDCTAIRLRSRLVTCTMTSMPRSCSSLPTARGSMAMRARGDSVMLSASTEPRSNSAVANNLVRSVPLGGVSSPVTTNCLAAIFAARLELMGRDTDMPGRRRAARQPSFSLIWAIAASDVAGGNDARGLHHQDHRALRSARAMNDAPGHGETLPGFELDSAILEIHEKPAFEYEEQFVIVVMLVPVVLALHH